MKFYSEEEGKILLRLARDAIKSYIKNSELIINNEIKERFNEKRGCFVTIKENNELRGCIGIPYPIYPLYQAVINSAISAAFDDPRFFPLKEEEIDKIKIELTILTPPKLLEVDSKEEYLNKIKIGKHGLIVKKGFNSGLLLPQVATEYNMNVKEFLEHTCLKAGLNKDAWKDKNTEVYVFEGQIFSED